MTQTIEVKKFVNTVMIFNCPEQVPFLIIVIKSANSNHRTTCNFYSYWYSSLVLESIFFSALFLFCPFIFFFLLFFPLFLRTGRLNRPDQSLMRFWSGTDQTSIKSPINWSVPDQTFFAFSFLCFFYEGPLQRSQRTVVRELMKVFRASRTVWAKTKFSAANHPLERICT